MKNLFETNLAERLMNEVEELTEAEKDIVVAHNPEFAKKYLHNIGANAYPGLDLPNLEPNRYLNTNVYSEHEHHERQFRMETGM